MGLSDRIFVQEKKAILLAVKKWQERKEGDVENDEQDIYAVNDDESDNEDITIVTDAPSSSQETSVVAHVSGMYPW